MTECKHCQNKDLSVWYLNKEGCWLFWCNDCGTISETSNEQSNHWSIPRLSSELRIPAYQYILGGLICFFLGWVVFH